jgi:hypothetical protein
VPPQIAFEDARRDCELNPNSFEAHYAAALICGYAALQSKGDPTYVEPGRAYLKRALRNGLPRELIQNQSSLLSPLTDDEANELIANAPAREPGYRFLTFRVQDPLLTANWQQFLAATRKSD